MATLARDKRRGTWHVKFVDPNGTRRTLYLGQIGEERGKWWRSSIEELERAAASGTLKRLKLADVLNLRTVQPFPA